MPDVFGTYTFGIVGYDEDGDASDPKIIVVTLRPPAPQSLTATWHGSDVDLAVTMSPGYGAGYARIYRSLVANPVSTEVDVSGPLSAPPSSVVNWTDVAPGAGPWRYRAVAEDAAGHQSLPTAPAVP